VQDEYLQEALEERGVVDINTLEPAETVSHGEVYATDEVLV